MKLEYTGTFEDGAVFDSNKGREPLSFTVGEKKVIKGFEKNIKGMKSGEEKSFKVSPEEGYGVRNEKFVQGIPREHLPKQIEPKKGMMLQLRGPDGQVIAATIAAVSNETVKLDLNHPLAGKTLNFKVKVLEIS